MPSKHSPSSVHPPCALPCRCTTSLNCNLCGLEGCTACSLGSYLSQSAAYPGRAECTRCEGCLDCSAKAGCTCERGGACPCRAMGAAAAATAAAPWLLLGTRRSHAALRPLSSSPAACKPGYFLSNASALVGGAVARLGACVSEQASGCAGSVDGVGCTACLAGSFLYKNADLGEEAVVEGA